MARAGIAGMFRRVRLMPNSTNSIIRRCCTCSPTATTGVRALQRLLHRDAVTRTLRGRRGSKLTAVTSGGTIPDNADYSVLLEPQGLNIGSVNEDFAVEGIAGDVFQLGNTSYRILRVETGKVRVETLRVNRRPSRSGSAKRPSQ